MRICMCIYIYICSLGLGDSREEGNEFTSTFQRLYSLVPY